LHRTRLLLVLLIAMVLGGAALIPLAPKLPLSVQRSLSMLPLKIDPVARIDAQASLEWRLEMWKILVPQIPQYFWIGKGYALSPSDLYLANEAGRRGLMKSYEVAAVSGNYHSGPLSILIPFGIFGMIGFFWFLAASVRVLYLNHRNSPPEYQNLNTFLLSYFVARSIFYFIGMGALSSDLPFFAGLIGLSIAVNGGVRSRSAEAMPSTAATQMDVTMLQNQPA
jgi:O-antigen ligase